MKNIKFKTSKKPIFCGYQMKLMIIPFAVLFAIFTVLPVLASMVLSLFDYDVMVGAKWAGIDNYIYINMLAADNVVETSLYTLDIWESNSYASEEFVGLLQNDGIKVKELAGVQSYGITIFPKIMYGRWFLFIFLCDLLCIAVVSIQWIKLQKQEIGIRRLVGGSVIDIVCWMTVKYLLYVGISMAISIAFCITKFSGYLHSLTVGYAITLPIILVILLVNVVSTARTPLEEAIK